MSTAPSFELFDERIAAGIRKAHERERSGIDAWLGVMIDDVWAGGLRAVVPVRPDLLTIIGNLHGGVLAALCDHLLGTVCYPVMAPGSWAATTEFKLNYLAPVTDGDLVATATIESMTRSTAVVRVEVTNDGRAVCLAQGTVLVKAPKPQ